MFPSAPVPDMSHLAATLTAVRFIEDHLQDDIKVVDVADAVHFSLFYFCRIFNQTAHHAPYDYLMRRRLTEAALLLTQSGRRITDVAFAFRFGSLEAFSRAFKRMFGCLPSQWQKEGSPHSRRLMNPLTSDHLTHRANVRVIPPSGAERPAFSVMGLATLLPAGETAVAALWPLLDRHIPDPHCRQPAFAVTDFSPNGAPTFSMAAVTCSDPSCVPPPLVSRWLPAAAYAGFATANNATARRLTADYIYQTWLPQSRFALAHPLEIARFETRSQAEDPAAAVMIYVPICAS